MKAKAIIMTRLDTGAQDGCPVASLDASARADAPKPQVYGAADAEGEGRRRRGNRWLCDAG